MDRLFLPAVIGHDARLPLACSRVLLRCLEGSAAKQQCLQPGAIEGQILQGGPRLQECAVILIDVLHTPSSSPWMVLMPSCWRALTALRRTSSGAAAMIAEHRWPTAFMSSASSLPSRKALSIIWRSVTSAPRHRD